MSETAIAIDPAAGGPPGRRRFAGDYLGMLAVLAGLILIFSLLSEHFFSLLTFTTLANQIPALMLVAVGMTYILIIAGIDLSVGSVMALSGAVLGLGLVDWQWPLWACVVLAVIVGGVCGLLNGLISVRWAIPSFIVTLGMLEIARGGAYLVTQSQTKYIGAQISSLAEPLPGMGLSLAFVLSLLVVGAGQVILSRTVWGRYMIAVGTNEQAVRLSGIDPGPIKLAVFVLAGLLTGVAGVFHTSRLAAADPNAGVGLELSAIAAVVIGGTSLMGGRGSVINSFFGVLIIAVLQVGLAQVGASEPVKRLVTGLVIVAAVIADVYRHRLGAARRG